MDIHASAGTHAGPPVDNPAGIVGMSPILIPKLYVA
jgi:hypothetical protein